MNMPKLRMPKGSPLTKRFGQSFRHKFTQRYGQRPTGTGARKMSSLILVPISAWMKAATIVGKKGLPLDSVENHLLKEMNPPKPTPPLVKKLPLDPTELHVLHSLGPAGLKKASLDVEQYSVDPSHMRLNEQQIKDMSDYLNMKHYVEMDRQRVNKIVADHSAGHSNLPASSRVLPLLAGTAALGAGLYGIKKLLFDHKPKQQETENGPRKLSSLTKEAPAKSKAQARFMAVWEKKHNHPEKAKEWFAGTSNKPEHVKKKVALVNALAGAATGGNLAYAFGLSPKEIAISTALGGLLGHQIPEVTPQESEELKRRALEFQRKQSSLSLTPISQWMNKQAINTGTDVVPFTDRRQPFVPGGSFGDKKLAEDKEVPSERLEYETIIRMIAEAHEIDLSTPEGIDKLPVIMREADHMLQQHEKLESHEDELAEQMAGQEQALKMQC